MPVYKRKNHASLASLAALKLEYRVLTNRLVNGVDKGADKGGRRSHDHRDLHEQSGERHDHRDFIDGLHLTSMERTSYNRMMVAGRAVYQRRMVQVRYLELDRATQLPPAP
jgi:hypothetical protein